MCYTINTMMNDQRHNRKITVDNLYLHNVKTFHNITILVIIILASNIICNIITYAL